MAYERLTAAARQGDERAIAALIQALLQPGCRVVVQFRDRQLEVELRAPQRLNQEQTLVTIADVLRSLRLNLHGITIMAYIRRETSPVWQDAIVFAEHHETARSAPIPQWLSEKPNFHAYRRLLAQNFDLPRLGLVIPFVLYGLFCGHQYTVSKFINDPPALMSFLHGVNLIFHEAGHILFMPFGYFMTILGGSLNQILIPAVIAGYFWFKGQKYSSAVTAFWVAENFWDVSIYVSDGRDTILPLLGGNEGPDNHDWHNLLSIMGIVENSVLCGSLTHWLGTLLYISAIGLAIYFAQKRFADRIQE
jgi:hypothetical protein